MADKKNSDFDSEFKSMMDRNAYYHGMEKSGVDIEKDMGFPSFNTGRSGGSRKHTSKGNGKGMDGDSLTLVIIGALLFLLIFLVYKPEAWSALASMFGIIVVITIISELLS